MVMSALHLAIIVITAIVYITPSEVLVITRMGKTSRLNQFLWFPAHMSLGQAQLRHLLRSCHLRKFALFIKRVQNSLLAFWCFVKELRTGNKRMLFSTDKFWVGYTPKVLSVLFKGIIQRTIRNPLSQLLFYDTSITFSGLLFNVRPGTVDTPAQAKGILEAWAMTASLQVKSGRDSCSLFPGCVPSASWATGDLQQYLQKYRYTLAKRNHVQAVKNFSKIVETYQKSWSILICRGELSCRQVFTTNFIIQLVRP